MARAFELINHLRVPDRARLQANHFAATAVELDRDGAEKQTVFLTIEFPLGEARQERTNHLTGETETLVYTNGLWLKTITDRRILEPEYDSDRIEIASHTYANLGSRQVPQRGVLLEETRTLEYWLRDLSEPGLDPHLPTLAKLHVNYVTGRVTRETFGLFELPVEIADEQYLTHNHYSLHGL